MRLSPLPIGASGQHDVVVGAETGDLLEVDEVGFVHIRAGAVLRAVKGRLGRCGVVQPDFDNAVVGRVFADNRRGVVLDVAADAGDGAGQGSVDVAPVV